MKSNSILDTKVDFATKQGALSYILEEAKERFRGKVYKQLNIGDTFKPGKLSIGVGGEILSNNIIIWTPGQGWIAKPIKETPLMLGNEVVYIEEQYYGNGSEGFDIIIKCKDGSVTKDEWMLFYKTHKKEMKLKLGMYCIPLGNYTVEYFAYDCIIGCIRNVDFDQIEAVTEKLKEL